MTLFTILFPAFFMLVAIGYIVYDFFRTKRVCEEKWRIREQDRKKLFDARIPILDEEQILDRSYSIMLNRDGVYYIDVNGTYLGEPIRQYLEARYDRNYNITTSTSFHTQEAAELYLKARHQSLTVATYPAQ